MANFQVRIGLNFLFKRRLKPRFTSKIQRRNRIGKVDLSDLRKRIFRYEKLNFLTSAFAFENRQIKTPTENNMAFYEAITAAEHKKIGKLLAALNTFGVWLIFLRKNNGVAGRALPRIPIINTRGPFFVMRFPFSSLDLLPPPAFRSRHSPSHTSGRL